MSITNGTTYKIVNTQANTSCVDLSAADNTTVIGYTYHSGKNQQWVFQDTGSGWYIKSANTGSYLGVSGTPTNNTQCVAVSSPYKWDIWHDSANSGAFKFYIHGTGLCVDLSGHGNSSLGAPVIVWTNWNGTNQSWKVLPI